jgi:hypothetical protein
MEYKTTSVQIGPGFIGSLFITFLILKLCNVITWSWWWIFAPLWIPAIICLVIFIIVIIVCITKCI